MQSRKMSNFIGGLADGVYGRNFDDRGLVTIIRGKRESFFLKAETFVPFQQFFEEYKDGTYFIYSFGKEEMGITDSILIIKSLKKHYTDAYIKKVIDPIICYCEYLYDTQKDNKNNVPAYVRCTIQWLIAFGLRWDYHVDGKEVDWDLNRYLPQSIKWNTSITLNEVTLFPKLFDPTFVKQHQLEHIFSALPTTECSQCFMEHKCLRLACSHYYCQDCSKNLKFKCRICSFKIKNE